MSSGPRSRRARLLRTGALLLVLLVVVAATLRFLPGSPWHSDAAAELVGGAGDPPAGQAGTDPAPTATVQPLPFQAAEVDLDLKGWYSWSVLDRRSGEITGSPNMDETSTTASMIKAWVVADQLRRTDRAGERPSDSELHDLSLIIRESNNELTHELWDALGGTDSIDRLIRTCELTDSSASDDTFWSRTRLSARDTARLGDCIADGTAAGPTWTKWLLAEMRQVHGLGDFGIRDAFPADQRAGIAIKNGWVERIERAGENEIHVNCLAVAPEWSMGVMLRYPKDLGYEYGMAGCEKITRALLAD